MVNKTKTMAFVRLNIISRGGQTLPGTGTGMLFNPDKILGAPIALSTGVQFTYPDERGLPVDFITDTYTTLVQLTDAINSNTASASRWYVGIFNATGGRATGTHNLVDLNGNLFTIPGNSRVVNGYYEVTTTFTSATDAATIALSIATDDVAGLKAAIAISNGANPYDSGAALKVLIQDGTVGNASEKTTAERAIQAVVATEALTAGKMYVALEVVTTAA